MLRRCLRFQENKGGAVRCLRARKGVTRSRKTTSRQSAPQVAPVGGVTPCASCHSAAGERIRGRSAPRRARRRRKPARIQAVEPRAGSNSSRAGDPRASQSPRDPAASSRGVQNRPLAVFQRLHCRAPTSCRHRSHGGPSAYLGPAGVGGWAECRSGPGRKQGRVGANVRDSPPGMVRGLVVRLRDV